VFWKLDETEKSFITRPSFHKTCELQIAYRNEPIRATEDSVVGEGGVTVQTKGECHNGIILETHKD
jgi:hypothetical protein